MCSSWCVVGCEPLSRAELLGLLADRDRVLAERDAEVAELRAQVAALEQRLARVERLVSRNSGNSSFPPSMDDQPGRPPPQKPGRQAGGRKPGKQPGAPGHHRDWREDPDETVPHFPAGGGGGGAGVGGGGGLGGAT